MLTTLPYLKSKFNVINYDKKYFLYCSGIKFDLNMGIEKSKRLNFLPLGSWFAIIGI